MAVEGSSAIANENLMTEEHVRGSLCMMNFFDWSSDEETDWIVAGGRTQLPTSSIFLSSSKLSIGSFLGCGDFGKTYMAKIAGHPGLCVIKLLPQLSKPRSEALLTRLEKQIVSMKLKSSEHEVYRFIAKVGGNIGIILPLFPASLAERIASSTVSGFTLDQICRYGEQICRALMDLHQCGILALNLSPSNCLINEKDDVVICSHGLPLLFRGELYNKDENDFLLGKPQYMAPEQWDPAAKGPLSFETDAWAFACTIIEMASGQPPWKELSSSDIRHAIIDAQQHPSVPTHLPLGIQTVLNQCFQDQGKRPSFERILKAFMQPHNVYESGDWLLVNVEPMGKCMGLVVSSSGAERIPIQLCSRDAGDILHVENHQVMDIVKDPLQAMDHVIFKSWVKKPRFGWLHLDKGTIQPLVVDSVLTSIAAIKVGCLLADSGVLSDVHVVDPFEIERESHGLLEGDWVHVHYNWNLQIEVGSSSGSTNDDEISTICRVLSVNHNGTVTLATPNVYQPLTFDPSIAQCEKLEGFVVGDFVEVNASHAHGLFPMPFSGENSESIGGEVVGVARNGLLTLLHKGNKYFVAPEAAKKRQRNLVERLRLKVHWTGEHAVKLLAVLLAFHVGNAAVAAAVARQRSQMKQKHANKKRVAHGINQWDWHYMLKKE